MHLDPGTTIEGNEYIYTVVSTLGQGAFGITYMVQARLKADPRVGVRTMALKEYFIKGVNGRQNNLVTCASEGGLFDKMRSRFINEARNLENFNSQGIVKIYEAFDANNTSYFSMEYISGGDLETYIKDNGPLPAATVKSFARQLAQALRIMHRQNILHLDMKPSNVMMRDDNSLVLIDFGFSKRFDDDGNPASSSTLGGGTELYRPLEQQTYKGSYHNGLPTTLDVYSLSATIYKMATGRDPLPQTAFDEQFPYELLIASGASPQLIEMLKKGLALRSRDRIQNMDEYLEIIETLPEEYTPDVNSGDDDGNIGGDGGDGDGDNGGEDNTDTENKKGKSTLSWAVIAVLITVAVGVGIWLAIGRPNSAPAEVLPAEPDTLLITLHDGSTFKYIGELDSAYTTPIPHGIGTGIYEIGTYVGEYRHGLRHGHGVFDTNDSTNHYEGTFNDDFYQEGLLSFPNGMYFKGTFNDGSPYTGTWYNANNTVNSKIRKGVYKK